MAAKKVISVGPTWDFPIPRCNNAGGDLCLLRRHFDVEIVSPPGDVFSSSSRTLAGSGSRDLQPLGGLSAVWQEAVEILPPNESWRSEIDSMKSNDLIRNLMSSTQMRFLDTFVPFIHMKTCTVDCKFLLCVFTPSNQHLHHVASPSGCSSQWEVNSALHQGLNHLVVSRRTSDDCFCPRACVCVRTCESTFKFCTISTVMGRDRCQGGAQDKRRRRV